MTRIESDEKDADLSKSFFETIIESYKEKSMNVSHIIHSELEDIDDNFDIGGDLFGGGNNDICKKPVQLTSDDTKKLNKILNSFNL